MHDETLPSNTEPSESDHDFQVTIYTAANSTQAMLLVGQLAERGIAAQVLNQGLQNGAAEVLGQNVVPKIVVADRDALAAREIAAAFDLAIINGTSVVFAGGEEIAEIDERPLVVAWPECADCAKPRHTACPFCGTAGSDFEIADHVHATISPEGEEQEHLLVLCPMCDEPFPPEFLRRCQWCGHDFGSGLETDVAPTEIAHAPQANPRVLATLAALGVVALALMLYFLSLTGR